MEDEKFLDTADAIARQFGGGTLFVFRHDPPRGFWWDEGPVEQLIVNEEEVSDED